MKESKFGLFLKKNGSVMFSIFGILVIAVAVMLIVNGSLKESENDPEPGYQIDLNEMAEGDEPDDSSQIANENVNRPDGNQVAENEKQQDEPNLAQDNTEVALNHPENNGKLESEQDDTDNRNEQVADNEINESEDTEVAEETPPLADMPPVEVAEEIETTEQMPDEETTTVSAPVETVEQKDAVDLFFEEGMGILWPVEGDVVMNYSTDHLIYHATLDQFRTHDAIAIAAAEGTEVVAAADGVVVSVENNVQTGITVTTEIGNDYYLVYGQLADSELNVGDSVVQGERIGAVAKASRFYSKEGDNLYFQVRCGEETLNPMSLLGRADETENVAENTDAVETTVTEE